MIRQAATVSLTCDHPAHKYARPWTYAGVTFSEATSKALKDGWVIVGPKEDNAHHCPACVAKGREAA